MIVKEYFVNYVGMDKKSKDIACKSLNEAFELTNCLAQHIENIVISKNFIINDKKYIIQYHYVEKELFSIHKMIFNKKTCQLKSFKTDWVYSKH